MIATLIRSGADSAATSLNQVAAGLRKLAADVCHGTVNLDWGGGKYDSGTDFLRGEGIENLVFDPYNRTYEHNVAAIDRCVEVGGAHSGTILNVLNVIPTQEERMETFEVMLRYIRADSAVVVGVYKGLGDGVLRRTSRGWQLNQPLSFYMEEIEAAFPALKVGRDGQYLVVSR